MAGTDDTYSPHRTDTYSTIILRTYSSARRNFYLIILLLLLPVQPEPLCLPFPVKPVGQVQVKLPLPLTHVAPVTQSDIA